MGRIAHARQKTDFYEYGPTGQDIEKVIIRRLTCN